MPCQAGPSYESERLARREREALTRVACRHMRMIDTGEIENDFLDDEDVMAWWAEHKARDASQARRLLERAEEERTRAAALAKLSPDERRVLGL